MKATLKTYASNLTTADPNKAGIFTSSFLVLVAFQLADLASALASELPPKWALAASAASSGLYFLGRGWSQSSTPPAASEQPQSVKQVK